MTTSLLPYGLNTVVVAVSAVVLVIALFMVYSAIKVRNGDKYAHMRRKAQELNLPIIKTVDLSGAAVSALGIVDTKQEDIYFDDKRISLRVRPSFLDVAEPIYEDGIKTYYYFGKWYFPTGIKGLTCLVDVVDTIRANIPDLNFIDDDLALIMTTTVYEGDALRFNAGRLLQDYEQSEYLLDEDGSPIQETEIIEQPAVGLDGEDLYDEDDEPVIDEVEIPLETEDGLPVYKPNTNRITENRLLELLKQAKHIAYSSELRSGFIPVRRAATLIPGRADGHRLDTLIKLAEKKRDLQHAKLENASKYMFWTASVVFGGIVACYLIYILMGKGAGA